MKRNYLFTIFILTIILSVLTLVFSLSTAADTMIVDYHYANVTLIGQDPDPAEPGDIVELRLMMVQESLKT